MTSQQSFGLRICITGLSLVALLGASGCQSLLRDEAQALQRKGQSEQALALIEQGLQQRPGDRALLAERLRLREMVLQQTVARAEVARQSGAPDVARRLLDRALAIDAGHPRVVALQLEMERSTRHDRLLAQAREALDAKQLDVAAAALRQVLSEAPGQPAARALQRRLVEMTPSERPSPVMATAYSRPVTLEFRDAPLRQVFETLSRSSGINFVFDRDVRSEVRVTVFLRNVSLEEALRVILSTQQLDRKLLNANSLLIYPNTPAKQREHQELVTRSLYLVNADVKQAQTLVRTMTKTRDVFVDERLNLLIVRDTPDVVRLIEKLVASLDLAEPEVMLDVEVLEIASNRLDELGLNWPDAVNYGIPGVAGNVLLNASGFRATIANPAAVATLRGTSGENNLLANPKIRARNREKAKVQIGERLPVFTTTAVANVGSSASVSYLDVGLKLEVEPSVQLDDEVIIKVSLDVSNLIRTVNGPAGSIAYQVGTRNTNTSLRLRDGETQILAGLINDEDRRSNSGLPGLSELPFFGRLFGVRSDSRNKTEVVLLITPRIIRNLALPASQLMWLEAGTDAQPGLPVLRLADQGSAAVGAGTGGGTGGSASPQAQARAANSGVVMLAGSSTASVGETVSVTLSNPSAAEVSGDIFFDGSRFVSAVVAGEVGTELNSTASDGRVPFRLNAGGSFVVVLRVLPAAAGTRTALNAQVNTARSPSGALVDVRIEGEVEINVPVAAATAAPAAAGGAPKP